MFCSHHSVLVYYPLACICCTVDQSFERMGFGVSHDSSGYAYMPQQLSAPAGANLNQYTTSGHSATYPNGSYVSSHHHQVALQVFALNLCSVCYTGDIQSLFHYVASMLISRSGSSAEKGVLGSQWFLRIDGTVFLYKLICTQLLTLGDVT